MLSLIVSIFAGTVDFYCIFEQKNKHNGQK